MAYSVELQNVIDQLEITKENILYLTIVNEYIQEMRDGIKDTEYRSVNAFLLSRLFKKNQQKQFSEPKPKTHILFQGGYNPDSPRVLIEMTGFVVGNQFFPPEKELKSVRYFDRLDLFLGKIVYDSLDYTTTTKLVKRFTKKKAVPAASKKTIKKTGNIVANRHLKKSDVTYENLENTGKDRNLTYSYSVTAYKEEK